MICKNIRRILIRKHITLLIVLFSMLGILQDVLRSLESHQQIFRRIHKDRSVDGVPVPQDQLQDMAER